MSYYFIPLLIILVLGAYLVIRANQRKWDDSLLQQGEKVVYEEEKIKFRSGRAENFDRTTHNLFLRLTNKRAFLLLANKQNVFTILDFTTEKENTAKENIDKATLFVKKSSMKVVDNVLQMSGENFMGVPLKYEIEVNDGAKVKKALGL